MADPKILFFDVNGTLLDLTPVEASVAAALGGPPALGRAWVNFSLQHGMAATLAGEYRDFREIQVACLGMMARSAGRELTEAAARGVLAPSETPDPWPDVVPAFRRFRDGGWRLVALTNSGNEAAAGHLRHAQHSDWFEAVLSVEDVGRFKPDRAVYLWAAGRMQVEPATSLLVAAHGWDVAGAAWAGMRTAFVGRPGQQPFPLGPPPDRTVGSLSDLADQLIRPS